MYVPVILAFEYGMPNVTKVLKDKNISCVIEFIGFAMNTSMCRSVLFMGEKLHIYNLQFVEVNALVEKLTIHFYGLKLAAEIFKQ